MHRHHDDGAAAAPGLAAPERAELIPEKRKPADEAGLLGSKDRTGDSGKYADDGAVVQLDADKRAATAVARAAMAGAPLYRLADGSFLAVWGVSRVLPDLDAVEAFLRRVEAAR